MSAPWMPLYVADYLADTVHLSAAESGAYLHLIMNYWRHGKLPADDVSLARVARMSSKEWARAKETLQAFFHDGWKHKRIDFELEKSARKSEARAEFGSRGGKAKSLNSKNEHVAKATILPDVCQPVATSFALASSSQPQSQLDTDVSNKRARAAELAREIDLEFESQFWPAYPNKVGKPAARKAWHAARLKTDCPVILDGLEFYKRGKPADRAWLNPATFLNQERWCDQPATVQARAGPKSANGFHSMFDADNIFDGGGDGRSGQSGFGLSGERGGGLADAGSSGPLVEIFEPDRAAR